MDKNPNRKMPERTCVGTGESLPKGDLLRFVKSPDGQVIFDVSGKAPGRGAYTLPKLSAVKMAVKKRALSRHLDAKIPDDLAEQVEAQLRKQALSMLGIAKKSSFLAIGLDEIFKMRDFGKLRMTIIATDVGKSTATKLDRFENKVQIFTKLELEDALNIPNTSVVGLTDKGIKAKLRKLTEFKREIE